LNIVANLLMVLVFVIIGFYILSAILELLSNIFKINISILDRFFGYLFAKKPGEMILQKLIGNIYSVFVEVLLWIIPIACAVVLSILLDKVLNQNGLVVFLGFIAGIIAGVILDVILYGTAIILFNIRSSLKNIKNN
jgi:hypothetical protein